MTDQATVAGKRPVRKELFLISLLALFCELLVIRWLATEVRIFAYFKNVPLMAAFLGLGLGFIWAGKKQDFYRWSAIALAFLSLILIFAFGMGLTYLNFTDASNFMLLGLGTFGEDATPSPFPGLASLAIMLGIFALATSVFVGLGQRMGQLFDKLRPLEAYSINIVGSLAGSILFSLLSWFGTSPGVWLIICGALFLICRPRFSAGLLIVLGILYSGWLGTYIAKANYGPEYVKTVWSPYYRIDVVGFRQPSGAFKDELLGYTIYINYDSFQSILNCGDDFVSRFPDDVRAAFSDAFSIPFKVAGKKDADVLVLGAGTGNDVAAALREGARHVDAIEIDPSIVKLGRAFHPEKPYSDPRTEVMVMDARTFLKNSKKKYDVIAFGALDSHTAFSSLSSLRLDNYIFTLEALQEARNLLKKDGIISIGFVVISDWLWDRHAKTLYKATGDKPAGYCKEGDMITGLILAGPGVAGKDPASLPVSKPVREINLNSPVPVAEDDWPFLFLPRREIPVTYVLPVLAILLIGSIPVAGQFFAGSKDPVNWLMFGLGMGFMLLEVRAMADLSLIFGSTWIVNSVVISGVMVVILIANWIALNVSPHRIPAVGLGLLFTLYLTTLVDTGWLSSLGPLAGGTLGSLIYLFPLIFSGLMFALIFKQTGSHSSTPFAYNLIGGLVGVCLEYLSMQFGIKALGFIAIAIYAGILALYFLDRSNAKSAEA